MIILVFASKWSLHCDFFSVFNCFCVCVFQEGISCSNVNHVHCDDHVLTTVIYMQISTIFQVIMYFLTSRSVLFFRQLCILYTSISVFFRNFLHIFCSISIKITNQISNLHSIRYTTLDLMVLEIREQLVTKVDVPQNLCSDVFSQEP